MNRILLSLLLMALLTSCTTVTSRGQSFVERARLTLKNNQISDQVSLGCDRSIAGARDELSNAVQNFNRKGKLSAAMVFVGSDYLTMSAIMFGHLDQKPVAVYVAQQESKTVEVPEARLMNLVRLIDRPAPTNFLASSGSPHQSCAVFVSMIDKPYFYLADANELDEGQSPQAAAYNEAVELLGLE